MQNKAVESCNWPGWPLTRHYGGEFDEAARRRMIEGSRHLKKHLSKYTRKPGSAILEIGPFFNPIMTPADHSRNNIVYWENDHYAAKWLKENYENCTVIEADISQAGDKYLCRHIYQKLGINQTSQPMFDMVIVSQVLNYIDHKKLFRLLGGLVKTGGRIFINNVVDYGLPDFFSEKRPKDMEETLNAAIEAGFAIEDKIIIPSEYPEYQPNPRLIFTAQRKDDKTDRYHAGNLERSYRKHLSNEGGFLPPFIPLSQLPATFNEYTRLLDELPRWYNVAAGGVRKWLDEQLRDFDYCLLKNIEALNDKQQHKLFMVLSLLAHCYRWNHMPPDPSGYHLKNIDFPDGLKIPFYFLADILEQPHCGTLYSTTTSNWTIKNRVGGEAYMNEEIRMDNLQLAHNLLLPPMDEQLERWLLTFTVMEAYGARAVKDIVALVKTVTERKVDDCLGIFRSLVSNIKLMITHFNKEIQFRKIDKNLWREWLQPTFIWGLEENGEKLEGASGLQLGAVQCIDIALGIPAKSVMGAAMVNSRKYMPAGHRDFFSHMDRCSNIIREFVIDTRNGELTGYYNQCIRMMTDWRESHKVRGKEYIKGDGTNKPVNSTGLSISIEDEPVQVFEIAMEERIAETKSVIKNS